MNAVDRPFYVDPDYARLRDLIIAGHDQGMGLSNWPLARLDSLRFGRFWAGEAAGDRPWEQDFHIWEAGDTGELLAVAHFEEPRVAALQVLPAARPLEPEMLAWIEARHLQNRPAEAAEWTLEIPAHTDDAERQALLARHGFVRRGPVFVTRIRDVRLPAEDAPEPAEFTLRLIDYASDADMERLAAATNDVFPYAGFTAATLRLHQHAPTWTTHWVAESPDGRFASFAGIWYEPALRQGQFEPVGTLAEFRRRGLARAVMGAGLRHLAALGALQALVDTGYENAQANLLYASLGFTTVEVYDTWEKRF